MTAQGVSTDPDTLRAMYAALAQERIDYNVRKWDVLRVASGFALGTFAAAGGLLAASGASSVADFIAGVVLIASAATLWVWARQGIQRESKLQYRTEYSMYQIERLLGLHREIRDEGERWLPDEPYLFGEKHRDWTFATDGTADQDHKRNLEWWVAQKVTRHRFVGDVNLLFGAFFIASVAFGIALISVGAN
jgi:hypothetical protein